MSEMLELPVDMQFLDDRTYLNIIKSLGLPTEEYTGQNAKMIAVSMLTKDNHIIDIFTNSSMDVSLTPEVNGKLDTPERQNVNISFVKV
ncbi:hypothetical protein, partial [Enterobacter quasiroggenkampii]